jgi:hypothetical protein
MSREKKSNLSGLKHLDIVLNEYGEPRMIVAMPDGTLHRVDRNCVLQRVDLRDYANNAPILLNLRNILFRDTKWMLEKLNKK